MTSRKQNHPWLRTTGLEIYMGKYFLKQGLGQNKIQALCGRVKETSLEDKGNFKSTGHVVI